jgi:hypothetical protein
MASASSLEERPLPMGLFQYGNAFLPDGENSTQFLAVSTIAVQSDDLCTSLYVVQSST